MATEIIMPKAGMAMEEGKIVRWLKDVGDTIQFGEGVIEMETDKITMESESPADGVLLAKLYHDGDTVPVTTVIGYIGKPGEKVPEAPKAIADVPPAPLTAAETERPLPPADAPMSAAGFGQILATPYAKLLASQRGVDLSSVTGSGEGGAIKARDVEAVKATPLASRIAADRGIDLQAVTGTGFGGKVTSADLPTNAPRPGAADFAVPLAGMRKVIAQRMAQSHAEIPPVTQNMKMYVDALLALRAEVNQGRQEKITINDFIIKAAAKALADFPQVRTEIDLQAEVLITRSRVNIGVAVALDEGLIVPVITDADKLSLSEISARAKDLAARARTGGLSPDEYSDSTFTISNLGAVGVYTFTPIINQPNVAIMGIGCINEELSLKEGQVVSGKYIMQSFTYDHRAVDGATAAAFQNRVRQLIENPMEILI